MSDETRYGPTLEWFKKVKERKLALPKNLAKTHWLDKDLWGLFYDLREESVELLGAITEGNLGAIEDECADVSNFAMMLADKARTMRRKKNVNLHPSITQSRVIEAVKEDDHRGFCIYCGEEASNVEPDARNYTCDACEEPGVFGAEELLFHIG